MANMKYDWAKEKQDFMSSNFLEISVWWRSKENTPIPYNEGETYAEYGGWLDKNTADWSKEKGRNQEEIGKIAQEKSMEYQAETLAQKSERRIKFYNDIRIKHIEKAILKLDPEEKGYRTKLNDYVNLYRLLTHEERLEDGLPNNITKADNNTTLQSNESVAQNILNELLNTSTNECTEQKD